MGTFTSWQEYRVVYLLRHGPSQNPLLWGPWGDLPPTEGPLSRSGLARSSCLPLSPSVQNILAEQPLRCARYLTGSWESNVNKSDTIPAPVELRFSGNRQVSSPRDKIITKWENSFERNQKYAERCSGDVAGRGGRPRGVGGHQLFPWKPPPSGCSLETDWLRAPAGRGRQVRTLQRRRG